jgi:hypothetical protein
MSRPDPQIVQRRAMVLDLRAQGYSFAHIAGKLGLASPQAAAIDVTRALESARDALAEQAGVFAVLEGVRLDGLEVAAQEILASAQAADDDELALKAVDRCVRISERRSRLLGLDVKGKRPGTRKADGIDQLAARRAARRAG